MRPDPDKIRRQLNRLLASPEFVRTERLARFLQYVVGRSADGQIEALRERQIGIEVFDRPPDWDPKVDNVVRSEARRLREKLDAYAASASPDETVRISIPKGCYCAEFVDLRAERSDTSQQAPDFEKNAAHRLSRQLRLPRSAVRLAGMLALLVCGLLSLAYFRHTAPREAADDFEIVPFSTEVGHQFSPAISPDGSKIAFVWDEAAGKNNIFIKDLKMGSVRRVTGGDAPNLHPTWAPDGQLIAFLRWSRSSTEVFLEDLQNGKERKVGNVSSINGVWSSDNPFSGCQSPIWSPDGKKLVLTDAVGNMHGSGLIYLSLDSGQKTPITFPPGEDQDCYPRFSHDGTHLAFVRYISHAVGEIQVADSNGNHIRQLTNDQRNIRGLDWSADGKRLVFASNRRGSYEIRTISSDGGDSQPLPSDTASASEPAVARSGGWMAYVESSENWNIWRVRIDNRRSTDRLGVPERFLASSGQNHSPSYSPDGKIVAFVSDRSGSPEIWFANQNGTNLRQMTHFGGPWLGSIRWSPDGKLIAFDARPKGHSGIFTLPTAGGEPHLLEQEGFEDRRPFWSRDGKFIYFDSTRTGKPQIWRRTLETGTSHPITRLGTRTPFESTDGSTLFYMDNDNHDLWKSQPDGTHPEQIAHLHPEPDNDWTVVGGEIIFAVSTGSTANIYSYRLSDRSLQQIGVISQTLSPGTPSLVVSPDGKWLLFAATDYTKSDIKIRREIVRSENRK